MSSLYSIGQMNEVADAFEEDGLTADHLKLLISNGRLRAVKMYLDGNAKIIPVNREAEKYLRLLSNGNSITIAASDGTRNIANSKELFEGYFDPENFEKKGLNVLSLATLETPVQVHEMAKSGTFEQIYGELGVELDKLSLTQAQIVVFLENHSGWLRADGYGTFFLFKEKVWGEEKFFVFHVRVNTFGLGVTVDPFSTDHVWHADCRRRFVIPQLTAAVAE